ncbi:MAG: TolC family protein [Thermodesulfovibrionales bacterium]
MSRKFFLLLIVLALPFLPKESLSLTLDEALARARESLPSYQAAHLQVQASQALYSASLGPYFPSLDASASWSKSSTSFGTFDTRTYDLSLSYTLFDWGGRKASREIALYTLRSDREEVRKTLLALEYSVTAAFYTSLAQRDLLYQRTIQLQDARKVYEVAEGRRRFGVAKLSDVLQASVRVEQARFAVVQAEGELTKALSDLNSLMGAAFGSKTEPEGSLDAAPVLPGKSVFMEAALATPEIKQAENTLHITENNRKLISSTLYPSLAAGASYTKTGGTMIGFSVPEEKTIALTASWNLFELGKFYRLRSAGLESDVSLRRLAELKRQVLLAVQKSYEDCLTAANQVKVAQEQLRQAEHNYDQAFGEYKVGKGDILSLVQAESLLSNAREQLITSLLNRVLSRILLERTAGMRLPAEELPR